MPDATDPTARFVRNLLATQRLANQTTADVGLILLELFERIERDLRKWDPTGPPQPTYRRLRVDKIIDALQEHLREQGEEIRKTIRQQAAEIGSFQADWATEQLRVLVGRFGVDIRPSTGLGINHFKRLLDNDPFRGELLADWVAAHDAATVRRVRRQINLGMANDEPLDDIIRRVRGTRVGFIRQDPESGRFVAQGTRGAVVKPRYRGGVLDASRRDTEAITRTAINHVQNRAHMRVYDRNADVIAGLQFTAVLDSRTTEICARWDSTVWEVGDDNIQVPPLHYNCRSVLTPIPDWKALDIEPPDEGSRAARTGADQKGTQVPASVDYEGWLKRQPASVQAEVLGRRKAELFRKGEISLRDIVTRDNRVRTVAELDPAA